MRPKGMQTHSKSPLSNKSCQWSAFLRDKSLVVSFSLVQEGEPGITTQTVHNILDPWDRLVVRMGLSVQVPVVYTQSQSAIFFPNTRQVKNMKSWTSAPILVLLSHGGNTSSPGTAAWTLTCMCT